MYEAWEPPKGGEDRDGKKILVEDRRKNLGFAHQELD